MDILAPEFRKDGLVIIEKQVADLSRKVQRLKLSDIATVQVGFKGAMTALLCRAYSKLILDERLVPVRASITANQLSEQVKTIFLNEYLKQKGLGEKVAIENP